MNSSVTAPQAAAVHPVNGFSAELSVPGDKSISHRLALMTALCKGQSRIDGFLHSEDCLNTLQAMESLGARVHRHAGEEVIVQGTGGRFMEPAGVLDMGNAGTGIRLLTGFLAGFGVSAELTGDESLCSRPMKRIKAPLDLMGAKITLCGDHGTPPIRIEKAQLEAITYELPMASAQVKSCILLAGLNAPGTTTVIEPRPTRDHTEKVFQRLGLPIQVDGLKVSLAMNGPEDLDLAPMDWTVPGDFSSAAFWMVAAGGRPDRSILLKRVGLNERRTALLDVLKRMGVKIEIDYDQASLGLEPMGDVHIQGRQLKGTEVSGDEIPNLIDELPLVAVAGALAEGKTVIRDAAELRVKESDRIAAMAYNLRLMGVAVEETEDGMIITGQASFQPGQGFKSFGDHRIAMAMAVLGLYADESMNINNVACTETSYPGFWETLNSLG